MGRKLFVTLAWWLGLGPHFHSHQITIFNFTLSFISRVWSEAVMLLNGLSNVLSECFVILIKLLLLFVSQ